MSLTYRDADRTTDYPRLVDKRTFNAGGIITDSGKLKCSETSPSIATFLTTNLTRIVLLFIPAP